MGVTEASEPRRSKSVGQEPVTSILPPGEVVEGDFTADDEVLASLGYRPEFKREFSLWTTFCVSFAVLGLLPSFASTLYYGMGYAGMFGMTVGWVLSMIFIQSVAMGMAEICSSMPTSGGLYYASAVLAPPGYGPLAAWVTGWSNWLGQITGAPSVDYALAAMILATASVLNPNYVPETYQVFLLTAFIMLIHGVISSMPTKWIANFNSWGSSFNILALIVVIIMIPAACNREDSGLSRFNNSAEVWGKISNETEWPNGIAVLMSFIGIIWTMSGYDAPFHLSEECSNANVAAPRAIVMTSTFGGLGGFALNLVTAYTVVDIAGAIDSDLGQPWAAYLLQCLPKEVAVAVLVLTIICGFFMGQGCMVAASRVTFAYARDGCFPFSRFWARVNKTTKTPVNAVWMNTVIGIALTLLMFGGSLTIGAIFSIGAIGAFTAFTIPIFIRTFLVGNRFRRGPWHLGKFSPIIGVLSSSFTAVMIPILCFPSVKGSDLDATSMNFTALVWGGPMFLSLVWWVVSAHKWFKGPRVNIEHHMLGRDPVYDGQDTKEDSSVSDSGLNKGKGTETV